MNAPSDRSRCNVHQHRLIHSACIGVGEQQAQHADDEQIVAKRNTTETDDDDDDDVSPEILRTSEEDLSKWQRICLFVEFHFALMRWVGQ